MALRPRGRLPLHGAASWAPAPVPGGWPRRLARAPSVTVLPLAPRQERQHIVAVPPDRLTDAVATAVRRAPCTLRGLARAAGVPPRTLTRITLGTRAATPAVATAVARALDHWSADCARLARAIRQAHRTRTA